MRVFVLAFFLVLLTGLTTSLAADLTQEDSTTIRQEFDALFSQEKIYQAIRKHLPDQYEQLFLSFEQAKRSQDMSSFKVSGFVNSIRTAYLKQSSDQTVLDFYRHIIGNGRSLLAQDPEAAYAYLFGGNAGSYAAYVDYKAELDFLGELFERILSTRQPENADFDRQDVEVSMNVIYLDLYRKFGEQLFLLHHPDHARLDPAERRQLCDLYLCLHEEIFNLGEPSRNHVLRSFASKL